jgi:fermentation-respiration switch protein FrsA (DUF1100 family)
MSIRILSFLALLFAGSLLSPPGALADEPAAPAGTWQGSLELGAIKLRLAFHLAVDADGKWSATLDSIDQGAKGIPLDEATFTDRLLTVTSAAMKMKYEGTLDDAGMHIDGTFNQNGQAFPLELDKVEKATELVRPQLPKPPLPYREVDVKFPSLASGVVLAGTLTLPGETGAGPYPAVALISGSGAQDRDETLLGHKPFLILADRLARRGIAVLRYDDRGTAQSTGDFAKADSRDFAEDALGAVAFLKARGDVAADRIGLAGHSEGGLIAPLAAVRSRDVAFIVLLAGPGVTGEQIVLAQGRDIAKAMGAPEAALDRQQASQRKVFQLMAEEPDEAKLKERLKQYALDEIATLPEAQRNEADAQLQQATAQFEALLSPWFRFFLTHDPAPTLRKVRCPVLAINGEKDLQVAAKVNLAAIEGALKAGGNDDATMVELPGLNHLFQQATTGAPSEYGIIEETINEAALATICDWVVAHTGEKAARSRKGTSPSRPCKCRPPARPFRRLLRRG